MIIIDSTRSFAKTVKLIKRSDAKLFKRIKQDVAELAEYLEAGMFIPPKFNYHKLTSGKGELFDVHLAGHNSDYILLVEKGNQNGTTVYKFLDIISHDELSLYASVEDYENALLKKAIELRKKNCHEDSYKIETDNAYEELKRKGVLK